MIEEQPALNNQHDHDGLNSKRIDPKNFLALPFFSTIPTAAKAPGIFIYVNGATQRLYVKHGSTLYYTALT
jgi:hypothetical protein